MNDVNNQKRCDNDYVYEETLKQAQTEKIQGCFGHRKTA